MQTKSKHLTQDKMTRQGNGIFSLLDIDSITRAIPRSKHMGEMHLELARQQWEAQTS